MVTIEEALNVYSGNDCQCPECGRPVEHYNKRCPDCGTMLVDPDDLTEIDMAASDSETGELLCADDDDSDSFSLERLYQGEDEDEDIEDMVD